MIALLTDFGYKDNYTGIVKGIIKGISPETGIIDITHSVEPFSILNGIYHLYSAYSYFPPGTVFYAVVDPDTGTPGRGLIAHTGEYIFTAPDNGLLSPFAKSIKKLYEIKSGLFPEASQTFRGRDIFAPVAAGLAQGKKPEKFAGETEEMVTFRFPDYTPGRGFIEGRVLHLDRFGNVVTSIPSGTIDLPSQKKILISGNNGDFSARYTSSYGDLSGEDAGILNGSSGFLELSLNMKSLAKEKEIRIEEEIRITYE